MAFDFKFDTKDLTKLTRALQGLHRSAFPVVVRATLNNIAFDTKKKEIAISAQKNFTVRNKNFFKQFSKVEKATGFNVNGMVAKAGMLDRSESQNFHEQEVGGSIKHVAIPHDVARTSGNRAKKLARRHWLNKGQIVNRGKRRTTRTRKAQFVADAAMAKQKKLWLFEYGTLWDVRSFRKTKNGVRIKLRPLYSIQRGRKVAIKGTAFIEEAATAAIRKGAKRHFKVATNKQFKKYFK